MTKVSKVYFGLSRAGSTGAPRERSAQPGGRGGQAVSVPSVSSSSSRSSPARSVGPGSPSDADSLLVSPLDCSTVTATWMSRPSSADNASTIKGRRRVSSTSFANSFGAARTAVSSTMASGRVSRIHARCCGGSAPSARLSSAWFQAVVSAAGGPEMPSLPPRAVSAGAATAWSTVWLGTVSGASDTRITPPPHLDPTSVPAVHGRRAPTEPGQGLRATVHMVLQRLWRPLGEDLMTLGAQADAGADNRARLGWYDAPATAPVARATRT